MLKKKTLPVFFFFPLVFSFVYSIINLLPNTKQTFISKYPFVMSVQKDTMGMCSWFEKKSKKKVPMQIKKEGCQCARSAKTGLT